MIIAEELFDRIVALIQLDEHRAPEVTGMLYDTLKLACREALSNNRELFGNLFSQVDYLSRKYSMHLRDVVAIQKMRSETRTGMQFSSKELLSHARALSIFISAIFQTAIPTRLNHLLPRVYYISKAKREINYRRIRALVLSVQSDAFKVKCEQFEDIKEMTVPLNEPHLLYLSTLLKEGMQVNLLDCNVENDVIETALVVINPDFLVDISSIARCFTDWGHHPLSYTYNRLSPSANSKAILLGHYSGVALDDIINKKEHYSWQESLKKSFSKKALEYCTCGDMNVGDDFKYSAQQQSSNIQQIVDELFHSEKTSFDESKAILEPSFICEELGIQGRVDLMTTDFKLLIEQKSGGNFNIERGIINKYGSYQREDHYVQLLLYYGVLQHNFRLGRNDIDIRLLYSKYPLPGGLVVVAFYQQLFKEAIEFRNRVVVNEIAVAQQGFGRILTELTPFTLNANKLTSSFYQRYIQPQQNRVLEPLQQLSPLEKAYFIRMMTFVYREQASSKTSENEGHGGCQADLWSMPLSEKRDAGNIYTGLVIVKKERSDATSGIDLLTFEITEHDPYFLPNFRKGDSVCLYTYLKDNEPLATRAILYKGTLVSIGQEQLVVRLNDAQQHNEIFEKDPSNQLFFALEHAGSDSAFTASIRSLHEMITAPADRKNLLLGVLEPRCDATKQLTKSYHPAYDDILLGVKQALDYYLLIGPPGTGKTSMALRFMVEEELTAPNASVLLLSYTNRAVDEICEMLCSAQIDFIRLGNSDAADPKFAPFFIERVVDECPKLNDVKDRICSARVIVSTTSTLQGKPYLFALKRFSLAIIDESSQIVESSIVGLLSAHSHSASHSLAIERFVMVGDHKQLPAVVRQSVEESAVEEPLLNDIGLMNCRESLFERLLRKARKHKNDAVVGSLRYQGRMHFELAEFVSNNFYAKEQLTVVPLPHQKEEHLNYQVPSVDELDEALKAHRLMFFPSPKNGVLGQNDKTNAYEARLVALLLARVYKQYEHYFDPNKTVGVIIPYRNQIAMIRKEIDKLGIEALQKISIDTVERYQGSQREVIIYSFTIQHQYQMSFLTSNTFVEDGVVIDRKLNVALTRARQQMLITGYEPLLERNEIFKDLIEHIKQKGGYMDASKYVIFDVK